MAGAFGHTGLHSIPSLFEAAAYPATLLIGLSLILWSLTITSLSRMWLAALAIPLVAFMFATHQLGAGIGLVGAGAILAFGLVPPSGSESSSGEPF